MTGDSAPRVLIVDDDEGSRYLAGSILRSGGFTILEAADGVEALAAAREEPPDVLVTDILMPKMDGFRLAREWKKDAILGGVPIVFLTASYTDPADEDLAMSLGAHTFLQKPVEPSILVDTVTHAIAGPVSATDSATDLQDEYEILEEYNQRLVNKLEQKVHELEEANRLLENAMRVLAREVDVKTRLINELGLDSGRSEDGPEGSEPDSEV